jgi:predicted Zn-dependent peptidase
VGYAVSSELESFDGVGSFCFEVSVYDPDRLEEVEEVIRTEMKDLRTNLVGTQELEKAKNLVVKAYNKGISQPEGRAVRLMVQEFQKIPYDFRKFEYYVRRLSARSLKEAARKYFTDDYTLCALVPK